MATQPNRGLQPGTAGRGPVVGDPVAKPHATHTWLLGWAVGSIAGHAPKRQPDETAGSRGEHENFADDHAV